MFPRALWVLFAGTFINRFGMFVLPFLVIYMTRHGDSATQSGLAGRAYGAGHLIASLLGGHLADRIGRRNTIAFSMFVSGGAMTALSQAHALPLILVITLIAGAAAPATAGFLAGRSFLFLFLGDAATSFAFGTIALFALPHGLRSDAKHEQHGGAIHDVLHNRPFLLFIAATLCITWIEYQISTKFRSEEH